MYVSDQQKPNIEVELPENWDITEETKEDIRSTIDKVDTAFRDSNFENDLETVSVIETGERKGCYLHREDMRDKVPYSSRPIENNRETAAVIDLAGKSTKVAENKQNIIFAHELGHEYFWSLLSNTKDSTENDELEELQHEQPSVHRTLNETFAELTALMYTNDTSMPIERNPFKEGYRAAFEGLEQTFNLNNRQKELEILEEIEQDLEEGEYQDIAQKTDELDSLIPDVDFRGCQVVGKQYNVFLVGMEDFFSTSYGMCTAANEDRIDDFANYVSEESGEINPVKLTKHTHGSFDNREVINKTKEVLNIENDRIVGKGSIESSKEEVKQASDEILTGLIIDRLEPTIDQVRNQIDIVESEDVGEYTFERLRYEGYGSSDGRVNEDMDLPHEIGGVLAETLYENDITPIDITENPTQYVGTTEEAIKETIRYGVETLRGSTDQEFGDRTSEDYKNRLEDLI